MVSTGSSASCVDVGVALWHAGVKEAFANRRPQDIHAHLQLGGGAIDVCSVTEGSFSDLPLELWGTVIPEPMQIDEMSWDKTMPTIRAQSLKEVKVSNRSPILFGSHEVSDIRTGAAPLAGAIFRIGDKLFFRPLVEETWLCLQDIGVRVPLRNRQRMELRLADGISGCTLHLEVRDGAVLVTSGCPASTLDPDGSQHDRMSPEGALLFQGSFDIGRGRGRPHAYCKAQEQGFKRCAVSRDLAYVPKYLACVRKDGSGSGGYWLEPHCDDMRRDPERLRSTWLRLSRNTAYYIPTGAREEHVAISIGGELFVVTSNTHDRLRQPTHAPPQEFKPLGNLQLFRRISDVLRQDEAVELGRACGMIKVGLSETAFDMEDDVQPSLAKTTTPLTVAPNLLDRCRCCAAARASVDALPQMVPEVQHALFTLCKRHGLSGYYRGIVVICDDMGCEDVTDLQYIAEDPEMFRKFTTMCERFPMGCVERLVEDVRNTSDLQTLAAKPDDFDASSELPFDLPGSVDIRCFRRLLEWCVRLPGVQAGEEKTREIVLGDVRKIEESCQLLAGEAWGSRPFDFDDFVKHVNGDGVLAMDGLSGHLLAKVSLQPRAENRPPSVSVSLDAARRGSIFGVASMLGHEGGLALSVSHVGEVMALVHRNAFTYSSSDNTWALSVMSGRSLSPALR